MTTTALLELADGSVALIDTEDIGRVAGFEWRLPAGGSRYAVAETADDSWGASVFLHRLIAGAGPDDIVIHRNHDTLDNRRENLVVMGRLTLPLHAPQESMLVVAAD